MTGSPSVITKAALGNRELKLNALDVIRWQPVQWQAMVIKGSACSSNLIAPQRQWPLVLIAVSFIRFFPYRLDD